MRLSQRYLDFNAEVTAILPYITTNMARLETPQAQLDALTAAMTTWTSALSAYTGPATHTPAAIEAMRMQYDSFYHAILALRQQLKNNTNITLTAEDFATIGIHIDKTTRPRAPVPDIAPINTLLDTRHLVNQISTAIRCKAMKIIAPCRTKYSASGGRWR